MLEGVSREMQGNPNYQTGVGYVILPEGQDRDKYIQTCFRRERVSILLDNGGGFIKDCYISRGAIQQIEFPDDTTGTGSCVAFINERFNNMPIIIGVISKEDESQLLEEKTFQLNKTYKNRGVNIFGRGKTGELFIDVETDQGEGGNIFINLRNSKNNANFAINCFGNTKLYSQGDIDLISTKNSKLKTIYIDDTGEEKLASEIKVDSEGGLTYEDRFGNKISADPEGDITIESGGEDNRSITNTLRGEDTIVELNKLKERLQRLIDSITNSPIVSGDGGAAIKAYVTAQMELISENDIEDFTNIGTINLLIK